MEESQQKILKNRLSELVTSVLELKDYVKMLLDESNPEKNTEIRFNFERVYEEYPKKMGKGGGLKKCRSMIKTQDDYENLLKAIKKYKEHIQSKQIELTYIQHFSTFMTSWRDWLDPNVGKVTLNSSHETTVQYLERKKKESLEFEEESEESVADPERVKALMHNLFKGRDPLE